MSSVRLSPRVLTPALLALLLGGAWALAQPPKGLPPQPQRQAPPQPPPSPVIARIDGRPVTQAEYDAVAVPYFAQLRGQLKEAFSEDMQKLAKQNVLNELFRRELLTIEAQRTKLAVTPAETDAILRQDPFFYTNGKFDQAKFVGFKTQPGSNYQMVLPRVQDIARTAKMDRLLRQRLRPTPAQLRAEFDKRNDQVHMKFVALNQREMQLDAEATPSDIAAYYSAHTKEFERRPKVRIKYVKLAVPPETDSLHATVLGQQLLHGQAVTDSLRAGANIDSLARTHGGVFDTGLFEVPPTQIPALGRVTEWMTTLAHADSDATVRVVGPAQAGDAIVAGVIVERQPRAVPPLREVITDVKRRADIEKRRTTADADRKAYYDQHPGEFHTPRLQITRLVVQDELQKVSTPSAKQIDAWYAANARTLLTGADAANQKAPPLNDSLRIIIRQRLTADARRASSAAVLARLSAGWGAGKDIAGPLKAAAASLDKIELSKGTLVDSLWPVPFMDSLVTQPATLGTISGPRSFGGRTTLWRVDHRDADYLQPYDRVLTQVISSVAETKRKKDDADAEAWYTAHRSDYKTKPKYVLDFISVKIPPQDSVQLSEATVRRFYDAHVSDYKQDDQVHARHILISADQSGGERADAIAKARADSLLSALRAGADFAEVAKAYSQDPGSGRNGGDLGWFGHGQMVKPFEEAAFALEPGQISQLVKTQFGYHIIQTQEKRKAGVKPYTDVRDLIKTQLATSMADSLAKTKAMSIRKKIAAGGNPEALALNEGGIQSSTAFAAGEPIPGIGYVQGVDADLPSLRRGVWAAKVYKENTQYVVVRLKDAVAVQAAEFSEVKQQASKDAQEGRKKALVALKAAELHAALQAGASLDSLAGYYGGLKDSGDLNRGSAYVPFLGSEPRLLDKAFAMKPGVVSDTLATAQGFAVLRVEEHKTISGHSFAADRAGLEAELLQRRMDEWVTARKKVLRVEILRADLREVPPPPKPQVTITRNK